MKIIQRRFLQIALLFISKGFMGINLIKSSRVIRRVSWLEIPTFQGPFLPLMIGTEVPANP
jgi:hypothetical protein